MNLLITGVHNYLGQAVVRRLIRHNPFRRVFGVGRRPPQVLGPVRFLPVDPRSDEFTDLLVMNDIQVVLHLAYALVTNGKDELRVARQLMEVGELAGVQRIVFASRDRVYREGETPRTEAAPLCGLRGLPAEVASKVAVEASLAAHEGSGCTPVIIRTGNIIGGQPGAPLDPVLSLPFLMSPRGRDPLVQFLDIEDAARIFMAAAERPDLSGAYNAAGPEPIRLSVAAGILQKPVWSLPPWVLGPMVNGLARAGRLPGGSALVRELLHGVPLASKRMQAELGITPRLSTRQTLALWRTGHDQTSAERAVRPWDPA